MIHKRTSFTANAPDILNCHGHLAPSGSTPDDGRPRIGRDGPTFAKMVEAQRLRDDLYYRLNVFPIAFPPLRERPEGIEAPASHFVRAPQGDAVRASPSRQHRSTSAGTRVTTAATRT